MSLLILRPLPVEVLRNPSDDSVIGLKVEADDSTVMTDSFVRSLVLRYRRGEPFLYVVGGNICLGRFPGPKGEHVRFCVDPDVAAQFQQLFFLSLGEGGEHKFHLTLLKGPPYGFLARPVRYAGIIAPETCT